MAVYDRARQVLVRQLRATNTTPSEARAKQSALESAIERIETEDVKANNPLSAAEAGAPAKTGVVWTLLDSIRATPIKSAKAAIKAMKNVVTFPLTRERREKDEIAFLPAALEIVEMPPSPIGRAIGATLIALFCLALIWASVGHVDIVASASGKIVPSGRVKLIQPFETGVVRAIHIRDGQSVKAGDVLIELDPTMTAAEQGHIRSDLIAAQLDIARLRAALSDSDNPENLFQAPAGASPALVNMQRKFLAQQIDEHRAKLAALDRQRAQKEAERATIAATIAKLDASGPLIQQRVDIRKYLADKELGSKLAYLEIQQLLTENEKDLMVQKSRLQEADAAIAAITESRAQADAEFHRTLFGELAEAERKAGGLADDLAKAEQRTKLQLLTAPVDGVVQQLSVHTVGGVVTPAQQLAVVVPADAVLEVEAMVSNRDIGFVHPGDDAQIKIDTFNFTRYGLLHGRVVSVSPDAIVRETPQDRNNDRPKGAESDSSEPKGQEFIYSARVSLDRTQIQVDDAVANLSPGMAVTVEIKTGSRAVISYLLSPLLRYQHESMHER
jgi:hemolysin D